MNIFEFCAELEARLERTDQNYIYKQLKDVTRVKEELDVKTLQGQLELADKMYERAKNTKEITFEKKEKN